MPSVERLFVRALDPLTHGNALGIGLADVTTDRLVEAIDWDATRINALSSRTPSRVRVPAHFPADRDCLAWIGPTAGRINPADVTYGWIRNTLELEHVAVSGNLRTEIERKPQLQIEREIDVLWDGHGNLVSPFE